MTRVATQHNLCEHQVSGLAQQVGNCGHVVEFRFNV